jgi:hypothetical protein
MPRPMLRAMAPVNEEILGFGWETSVILSSCKDISRNVRKFIHENAFGLNVIGGFLPKIRPT